MSYKPGTDTQRQAVAPVGLTGGFLSLVAAILLTSSGVSGVTPTVLAVVSVGLFAAAVAVESCRASDCEILNGL